AGSDRKLKLDDESTAGPDGVDDAGDPEIDGSRFGPLEWRPPKYGARRTACPRQGPRIRDWWKFPNRYSAAGRPGSSLLQSNRCSIALSAKLLQSTKSLLPSLRRLREDAVVFDLSERAIVPIVSCEKTDRARRRSGGTSERMRAGGRMCCMDRIT